MPETVTVAVMPVELDVGVTVTEAPVAVVGVAPVITQEYAGLAIFIWLAVNVVAVGVNAPETACVKLA